MADVDYVFATKRQQSWSFRSEGYTSRRAFLRSYPLRWEHLEEEEEEEEEEEGGVELEEATKGEQRPLSLKRRLLSAFHWGEGKALLLRKLKDKAAFYLFSSCNSIVFHKPSMTKPISPSS